MAQAPEEGGGEGAAGGGKGLAPGYTADDRAEFVFFCSEIMDCSLDFRVLIAAVSQVPLGAGPGAEDGADWVLLAPGAASTLSHVQLGEQEESSLHMRWGIWPSQMLLAAVQPPQWAVVLHHEDELRARSEHGAPGLGVGLGSGLGSGSGLGLGSSWVRV